MLYPAVTLNSAVDFLEVVRHPEITQTSGPLEVERRFGDGDTQAMEVIREGMTLFKSQFVSRRSLVKSADQLEGELVPVVHETLSKLPPGVLSDRDFWRYLSLTEFFGFAVWRDGSKESIPGNASFGATGNQLHDDTVPMRMFNRGELALRYAKQAGQEPSYDLAKFAGSEMWKSHIWRTLNWQSPRFVSSLFLNVELGNFKESNYQVISTKSQELLREFVKQLKRQRSNVIIEVLDDDECQSLLWDQLQMSVSELRKGTQES